MKRRRIRRSEMERMRRKMKPRRWSYRKGVETGTRRREGNGSVDSMKKRKKVRAGRRCIRRRNTKPTSSS